MRKTNRMIAGVTAVSLFGVTLIPVTYTPVYAEETFTDGENRPDIDDKERDENQIMVSGNFKYSIDDDQAEIRGILDDSMEIIIIPDEIDGKTVTRICDGAFENCKEIKTFMLPDTLKIIGCRAFYNTEITEIDIPDSVTKIDTEAFSNCKNIELIDLSGNSNLKNIYTASFQNCISLSKVILPKTMNNIYPDAFHGCTSLTDIIFPESINTIDKGAFSGCTGITELNLPEESKCIYSKAFEGCTGISKLVIPESTYFIDPNAFKGCFSIKEVIMKAMDIPYDFIGYSDEITFYVYSGSLAGKIARENNLKCVLLDEESDDFRYIKSDDHISITGYKGENDSVTIPETIEGLPVTEINQRAFEGSLVNQIIIPDCVKSIRKFAFSDCSVLRSIKLPDGLTELEDYVFEWCTSLENIEIPSSVTNIHKNTFMNCNNLKELNIPENVEKLGYNNNIFEACENLNSVTVDENNKNFSSENGVLYNKDKTILICYPRGKTQERFVVPKTVTEIIIRAFYQCKNLKSVEISGDNCQLNDESFFNCPALECFDIGINEGLVYRVSFHNCPLLKKISVSDDNKAYSSQNGMFLSKDKTELIFYLPGYEDTECIVPDSVKIIHEYAFSYTQNLRKLILPEGITSLDKYIFSCNNSIETIILPDSLEIIDFNIFSSCEMLEYIEFGEKIKDIKLSDSIWFATDLKKIVIKNPECTFSIWNEFDPDTWKAFVNCLTIYSYENSSAERFCRDNNIRFFALKDENRDTIIYGDLDGDKNADLSDFVMLSQYLLRDIQFNSKQKKAADVQYDGCVDISDLARLKQFIMKDDVKLGKQ